MTSKRKALPYKLLDQANREANDEFARLASLAATRIKKIVSSAEADPGEQDFVAATTESNKDKQDKQDKQKV